MVVRELKVGDVVYYKKCVGEGCYPGKHEVSKIYETRSCVVKNILLQRVHIDPYKSSEAKVDVAFVDTEDNTHKYTNVGISPYNFGVRRPEELVIEDSLIKYHNSISRCYEIPFKDAVGEVAEEIISRISCSSILFINSLDDVNGETYTLVGADEFKGIYRPQDDVVVGVEEYMNNKSIQKEIDDLLKYSTFYWTRCYGKERNFFHTYVQGLIKIGDFFHIVEVDGWTDLVEGWVELGEKNYQFVKEMLERRYN